VVEEIEGDICLLHLLRRDRSVLRKSVFCFFVFVNFMGGLWLNVWLDNDIRYDMCFKLVCVDE